MQCKKCGSNRVAIVNGKTSDMCQVILAGNDQDGYVPHDMNIGGGDYLEFEYCLQCGQMQGQFPLPPCEMEHVEEEG